jgi:uncharacterized protein
MGYTALADLLIRRGANIESRNGFKETPLLVTVRYFNEEMSQFLLEMGADVDAMDQRKETIWSKAVRTGNERLNCLLLERRNRAEARSPNG